MKIFQSHRHLFVAAVALAVSSILSISSALAQGGVALDKSFYLVHEPMNITPALAGLTKDQASWAKVGFFYTTDTPCADALNSAYADSLINRRVTLKAPRAHGNYEARLYDGCTVYSKAAFTVGSLPAAQGALQMNGTEFLVRDKISVTITGLSTGQVEEAWAGVFLPTDAWDASPLEMKYMSMLRDGKTWTFNAPSDFGTYEVRVFTTTSTYATPSSALYGKLPFTVTSHTAQAGELSISGGSVIPGASVTVRIGGLTSGQINDGAWAGVFYPSDSLNTYALKSTFVSSLRDGFSWTFTAPQELGDYEVRVTTKYSTPLLAESLYGILSFRVGLNGSYRFAVKPNTLSIRHGRVAAIKVLASKRGSTDGSVNATKVMQYRSKNTKIAVVDSLGVVRGLKPGSTEIAVSYNGKVVKSVPVTVK